VRIYDTFMFNSELDMLECRLTELESIPNLTHVVVEADVDHQDHPKPYHLSDNLDRFAPWKERLFVVRASGLPSAEEFPDPWSREHAQREWVGKALRELNAADDDVVLHGDCDEIPTAVAARNVRPRSGVFAFDMTCFSMAVDWLHPDRWNGTVAASAGSIRSFAALRDTRNFAPVIPNAGWHLGWLGGKDAQLAKLGSFCHPEIAGRTLEGINDNLFLTQGFHVDGKKLIPVDVNRSWPRWVAEKRCPSSWFRDRTVETTGWQPKTGPGVFHEEWFGPASQQALRELFRRTTCTGEIVEVGCWEGRSTIALADACKPQVVRAVDTWEGSPGEISAELAQQRDVLSTFMANTAGMNIDVYVMGWRDYFESHRDPIRFLHIDATHTYEEVRDNIRAALPFMQPGSIICGDDVHHPPVQRAVNETLGRFNVLATLWWVQLPEEF
jgi:predicted O-methyltransferase YrrM